MLCFFINLLLHGTEAASIGPSRYTSNFQPVLPHAQAFQLMNPPLSFLNSFRLILRFFFLSCSFPSLIEVIGFSPVYCNFLLPITMFSFWYSDTRSFQFSTNLYRYLFFLTNICFRIPEVTFTGFSSWPSLRAICSNRSYQGII